jgi:hypothetical protein
MTYDASADRIILFGGEDNPGGILRNYTYIYTSSNNTWWNATPTVADPDFVPRWHHIIEYDSTRQRVMLFGGYGTAFLDDTWFYTSANNTWWNANANGAIPGTAGPAMVYDAGDDQMVLFGGQDAGGYNNDTWIYTPSNNTWWEVNFKTVGGTLKTRARHKMVYDSSAERVIMYGGEHPSEARLNDTWIFNFTDRTWYKATPSFVGGGMRGREEHTMIYDSSSQRTILFGGWNATPPNFMNDTWIYNINDFTATITWNTDEPSDSVVNYGTTTALGNTESDAAMVTSHSITLTNILPETTYYFEVQSTDASENAATDNNNGSYYTFTTTSTPSYVMHVQSIDMWYEKSGINYMIYTKVWIVDSIGDDVEDATVYIETDLPGGGTHTDNGVTDSDGTVTFSYGKTKVTGTYTSTVTNVVKDGWTYDPSENLETNESLIVP